MILQLNPMIPIYRVSDKMEGYAFLVIDYSQEHNILFTCAMDDGEVWTLSNKEIRFYKNISLDRLNNKTIKKKKSSVDYPELDGILNLCKDTSQTKIKFTEEEWAALNNETSKDAKNTSFDNDFL